MSETIEITTPDDRPGVFVATFQEPTKIETYGTGASPAAALEALLAELRSLRIILGNRERSSLAPDLLEALAAIEDYLKTF
jgi:hypothetical protein